MHASQLVGLKNEKTLMTEKRQSMAASIVIQSMSVVLPVRPCGIRQAVRAKFRQVEGTERSLMQRSPNSIQYKLRRVSPPLPSRHTSDLPMSFL